MKEATIFEIAEKFNTEEKCLKYLEKIRGTGCPDCSHTDVYRYSDKKTFKCKKCERKFTLKVGTVFEHSRVPLKKWFIALYYMKYSSKGISSIQLGKQISVSQQTAWFMYYRIRETYKQNDEMFKVQGFSDCFTNIRNRLTYKNLVEE